MMRHYRTKGVCARIIGVDTDGVTVKDVEIHGGCRGQGNALRNMVVGQPVADVIRRLKGTECHGGTSCADQLARALESEVREINESREKVILL